MYTRDELNVKPELFITYTNYSQCERGQTVNAYDMWHSQMVG